MTLQELVEKKTKGSLFYLVDGDKFRQIDQELYDGIKDKEVEIYLIKPTSKVNKPVGSDNYEFQSFCQVYVNLVK